MSTTSTDKLIDIFVEVADTLVEEFDLMDFLSTVVSHAVEVSNTAAVGLLLADQQGHLQLMAASRESARLLELFVLQNDEGPCRSCYTTGEAVVVPNLDDAEARWPAFTRHASEAGFQSVCAIPMKHSGTTIGVLNMFNLTPDPFEAQTVRVIQALADIATIGLLQERSVRSATLLTEQLQGALNTRVVIEQAKGVLAQKRGLDITNAFIVLRAYARGAGLPLSGVARDIVTNPHSHPELTSPSREVDPADGGDPDQWPGQQAGLTERESTVLSLITQGWSNHDIAQGLHLSPNTLKSYIRSSYHKIGVTTRARAVIWGMTHEMAQSPST
ncbi:MAG: GAF domain-containing protein [Ornithinimicrobium sp.]